MIFFANGNQKLNNYINFFKICKYHNVFIITELSKFKLLDSKAIIAFFFNNYFLIKIAILCYISIFSKNKNF